MDENKVVMFVSHIYKNCVRRRSDGSKIGEENMLDDISFKLHEGEVMGILGETGSGKTLLLETLLYLKRPDQGDVFLDISDELRLEIEEINRRISKIKRELSEKYGFNEREEVIEGNDELDLLEERYEVICRDYSLSRMKNRNIKKLRSYIQPIFQEIFTSLDPSKTVRESLAEPMKLLLHLKDEEIGYRILSLISDLGLKEEILDKFPSQLQGSSIVRICVARAYAVNPKIIIIDDPTAFTDVTSRAKLLNFLRRKQKDDKISLIIISNNLNLLRSFTQNIAVIHRGELVEMGSAGDIFSNAMHPYTKILVSSNPNMATFSGSMGIQVMDQKLDYEEKPRGCSFHTRCPNVMKNCGWSTRDIMQFLKDSIDLSRKDDPRSIPEIEEMKGDENENIIEISFKEGEEFDQNLVKKKIEDIIAENLQRTGDTRFESIEFVEFDAETDNLVIQLLKPFKPYMQKLTSSHLVSCFLYHEESEEEKE